MVELATHESPEARYAAASELEADLSAWLKTRPVTARGGGFSYRFGRLVQRNKFAAVLATAAVLVVVGSSIWFTWQLAEERDVAKAALEETEAALARAEDLREFLVDLFRATEPDRPRDQLPSTEELLALGARRALDENAAPPAERLGMLLVLGEVFLALYQAEDAEQLLDAAVVLGRAHTEQQPVDLARALELQGQLAMHQVRWAEAQEWFTEAETLVDESGTGWNTFASIRESKSELATLRGNHHQALGLIEPVYLEIHQGRQVQPRVHYRVLTRVAMLNAGLGDPAGALEVLDQAADLIAHLEGEESLANANEHLGRAGLMLLLGRFDAARDTLLRVLALTDRIAEHPIRTRALTYFRMGYLKFYTGQYNQALDWYKRGIEECAASRELTAEDHPCGMYGLGWIQAYMHRWEHAEKQLLEARTQFTDMGAPFERWLAWTKTIFAFVACHQGRIKEGAHLLDKVHAHPGKDQLGNPGSQAHFLMARAVCHYKAGDYEQALEPVDRALEIWTHPGLASAHAERRILRARILAALGHNRESAESLDHAQQQLETVGLPDHPVMKRIHETRQDLF